jgi:hypothetical protein
MDTAERVGKSGDDLAASVGRLMAMTEAELDKWLAAYKKSWESQDPALFAGLFTEDYAYRDAPFVERVPGPEFAAFWRALAKLQSDDHIEFEVLRVRLRTSIGERCV